MPDLRYRTFRMKVYARLYPPDLTPQDREGFLTVLDRMDDTVLRPLPARLLRRPWRRA